MEDLSTASQVTWMIRLPSLLADLPPLGVEPVSAAIHACKICGSEAVPFDRVDFNKFCDVHDYYRFGSSGVQVAYLRCLSCGFIYTENLDDWTGEEFATFIYNADYFKVDPEYVDVRPDYMAAQFAIRFHGCEHARILDYGSGAGVFVDRMRRLGYHDIVAYDPFSSPERPEGPFDIITCFEVIEHSTDPMGTLGDMKSLLREDGCILLSQTLQPPDILTIRGTWWYLAPRNGHVSTYSAETLVELGRRHGLVMYNGANIYGFAPIWPSSFALLALRSAGSSFNVLRLFAPADVASSVIALPSRDGVVWHPTETAGSQVVRWTGVGRIAWEAHWDGVATLQVRVPFVDEAESGLALICELELNGQRKPVRLDRGELVADFDVAGCISGTALLHIPEPAAARGHASDSHFGRRGLAIRTEVQQPATEAGSPGYHSSTVKA